MLRFADCEVDLRRFELRRNGAAVHVERQVFAVLAHLIRHRDRVVTKGELLDAVWGDRFVSESTLSSRIKSLRRAVGDGGRRQRVIATVHGVGYRFAAQVQDTSDDEPHVAGAQPTARVPQQIRYAVSPDGVRVAYAISGSGPPLVKAANWLTHLDLEWDSPIWAHYLDFLARDRTLLRYDERGCGLSDRDVPEISFDAFVRDLELVVDKAGLERFPLLGMSQGGPVAIAYAVRNPDRVSRLILAGAYIRGRYARATTPEEREEAGDLRAPRHPADHESLGEHAQPEEHHDEREHGDQRVLPEGAQHDERAVGAEQDEGAVGDVDDPQHAHGEAEPQREHCVDEP
jgi:DNA-binding winged helix-turn-helix (wHTH) protein